MDTDSRPTCAYANRKPAIMSFRPLSPSKEFPVGKS